MPWRSFLRSYGTITGKRPRGTVIGHIRYVLRDGECAMAEHVSYGEPVEDRQRILDRWRLVYDQETGRAPLEGPGGAPGRPRTGPRGRYDARVMERLAVPLPNGIFDGVDPVVVRQRIRQLAAQLSGGSSDVVWALHRGERVAREDNLHLHILFRPRGLDGRKMHISRAGLRALRRRQLGLITGWLIRMGIDAQVPAPGGAPHLGPQKMALAARGITLHSKDDQRMALALDLAHASRQITAAAARRSWEAAEAEGGEESLREDGWKLEQVGSRGTWTLILEALPRIRFAIRRLIGIQERDVEARIQAMRARAAEAIRLRGKKVESRQIELARHPRTGEVALWDAGTSTILVLDNRNNLVRRVYVRRLKSGEINWTAVGCMAIGRRHLGDGDTCGAIALGHDPVLLDSYVTRLQADECRTRPPEAIPEDCSL